MRAIVARMDLVTVAYVVKILAAVVGAIWALVVVYDVTIAEAPPREVAKHVTFAVLALGIVALAVMFPPIVGSNAYDAPR